MTNPLTILVVDDDEVDQEAVRRAILAARINCPIVTASDGIEALSLLRGGQGRGPITMPYLILLDLNMPRMDGFEFLRELRQDPIHGAALVFVLTTSSRDQDMIRSYDYHVAGYVTKAAAAADISLLAKLIDAYRRLVAFPV